MLPHVGSCWPILELYVASCWLMLAYLGAMLPKILKNPSLFNDFMCVAGFFGVSPGGVGGGEDTPYNQHQYTSKRTENSCKPKRPLTGARPKHSRNGRLHCVSSGAAGSTSLCDNRPRRLLKDSKDVLCTIYYILYTMYHVLCTMYCVLCTM